MVSIQDSAGGLLNITKSVPVYAPSPDYIIEDDQFDGEILNDGETTSDG